MPICFSLNGVCQNQFNCSLAGSCLARARNYARQSFKHFAAYVAGANQVPFQSQTRNSNARIWWDSSVSAYRMTVPFNAAFVELFKSLIPHSDRNHNPESKIWTITEKYFDATRKLIASTFGEPQVITREATEKASQPPPVKTAPLDSVILQFAKLLPYEAMQKAYRAGALALHPDRGGDMDKMASLNACWTRLETEYFKKLKSGE